MCVYQRDMCACYANQLLLNMLGLTHCAVCDQIASQSSEEEDAATSSEPLLVYQDGECFVVCRVLRMWRKANTA